MSTQFSGLLGILILVADIWALINIVSSPAPAGEKTLWALLVILLPVIGLILWFLLGPKSTRATI